MANKKLIKDLRTLVNFHEGFEDDFVRDVAARALEELEYLDDELRFAKEVEKWRDFKSGDMK